MKLSAKILATFFTLLSLFGASLLWTTRVVDLKSQSMYFDQSNVVWYILMHIGIMMTFWIMNSSFAKKKVYGLVSFASLLTLGIDLGLSTGLHNFSTAALFILACYSIIVYGGYKLLYWVLCSIAAVAFVSGLFNLLGPSGIFLGETIAEYAISLALLHQIWIKKI